MKQNLFLYGLLIGFLFFATACNPVLSPTTAATSPAHTPVSSATPTATSTSLPPTLTPTPAPGMVTGSICYPSQENPPIVLYLQNTLTGNSTELNIPQGQPDYQINLWPGEYTAYALTVGTELAGSYSQAVPCGLHPTCTDHRPLSFEVQSGQTTAGINLCDWYNPPGSLAGNPASAGVVVTTVQKTHVFTGPGLEYPLAGFAPARASAPAMGRTADSAWLQIKYPVAEGSAWIYAPLVQVAGSSETLPVITLPTKKPALKAQFTPTSWHASLNKGVVHFKGSVKDEQGRPVNGFSILADNGTWSVLSHPTGASRWYPDLRDGEWDIVITNATDAAGWWTLTIVSYDCPDFEAGFNAQCKQFTRLTENYLIKVVYPDETVINANWICQQGCNEGLYNQAYRP